MLPALLSRGLVCDCLRGRGAGALSHVVNRRYERGHRTVVTSNHGLLPSAAPDGEPAWVLRRDELVVADRPQSCGLGCTLG